MRPIGELPMVFNAEGIDGFDEAFWLDLLGCK
jgi:hypothetical protein